MNIFAKGNKLKLLFVSGKGQVSIQDLFDLPESKLRTMANILNRGLKQSDDLFAVVSTEESDNKLRLDIIMEVISIRSEESSEKIASKEVAQEKSEIRALIAKKKLEERGDLSIAELEKLL